MELFGGTDVTSSKSLEPRPPLPAILESLFEGCDGGSVGDNPTRATPVVNSFISDSDRSSKLDANLHIHTQAADDIALDEFCIKWEGTNLLLETDPSKMHTKGKIERFIKSKSKIESSIKENPYDPLGWLLLSGVYFDQCYSDLQVSAAHKARILIAYGMDLKETPLGQKVRISIVKRLSCFMSSTIDEELEVMRFNTFTTLLRGLCDAESYADGLSHATMALKFYPGNEIILAIREMLREDYAVRLDSLKNSKATDDVLKYTRRCGRINKKKYPWMDEKLFIRTLANLATYNRDLNSENCEIRPTQFQCFTSNLENNNKSDVGPLGIFATRDIDEGEILLFEYNTTLVSNIPPSQMTQCEACHASLHSCFFNRSEIRVADCCRAVAYCSAACHDLATNGYHKLLCRQDFRWLYENTNGVSAFGDDDASWRPLALLRLLAVIISDFKSSSVSVSRPHPLQHPLVARLTANYTSGESSEQEWNYFSHVVAPNRILMQFGVDIFSELEWSAEVIHTLYWRMMTNACKIRSPVMNDIPRSSKIVEYAIVGISPGYVFFNHGCEPEVAWMPAGDGYGRCVLAELKPPGREMVKIGGSAIVCVAMRDLKKDEELRISYVPMGDESALGRWTEGKCACEYCAENAVEVEIYDAD